MKKSKKI